MCGLTGVFDTRGRREIRRELILRMNEAQHHRGPDEGGLLIQPGIGLGHRRLSIIDVATGQQPLFNEDGSVAIVYNGEIYNFQELIPELTALGHVFHTRSDTEVIVHAWEAWGADCVKRFRGMFAFALWDRNQRNAVSRARSTRGQASLLCIAARWADCCSARSSSRCWRTGNWRATSILLRSKSTWQWGTSPSPAPFSRLQGSCRPAHTLDRQARPAGGRSGRVLGCRVHAVRTKSRSRMPTRN